MLSFHSNSEFITNRQNIHFALEELKNFKEDGFLTIPKINRWLLKYYGLYKYCKENWNNCSCVGELPCNHTLGSEEDKFRDFHESLEKVADLHKKEPYFQEQMLVFDTVCNDSQSLMQWLLHNEKLGVDDFLIFWIEWLEEDHTVKPFILDWSEIDMKFSAEEW